MLEARVKPLFIQRKASIQGPGTSFNFFIFVLIKQINENVTMFEMFWWTQLSLWAGKQNIKELVRKIRTNKPTDLEELLSLADTLGVYYGD